MNKINYKLVNMLLVIAIICLLYLIRDLWLGFAFKVFEIVAPFLLAFGIAYVIYPIVKKLIDAGSPKWLAILSVSILGVGSIILIVFTPSPSTKLL